MKRRVRWILIAGLVLGTLFAGRHAYIHFASRAVFSENDRLIKQLEAAYLARDETHTTLGAPDALGDARAIYASVMADLDDLTKQEREFLQWGHYPGLAVDELSDAERQATLTRTRAVLEALRPILTAPLLRVRAMADFGDAPVAAEIARWEVFQDVVSTHVSEHLSLGQVAQAIDLLVLRSFAGLDLARDGIAAQYWRGHVLINVSSSQLRDLLADHPVPPERLDRLATELAFLRAAAPSFRDLLPAQELLIRRTLRSAADGAGEFDFDPGARWLQSDRLAAAHLLRQLPRFLDASRYAGAGPVLDGMGRSLIQFADIDERLVGWFWPDLAMAAHTTQFCVPRVVLLEVTVALARYREKHERMPARLDALVPEFLPAVPTHPRTGRPLLYVNERLWAGPRAEDLSPYALSLRSLRTFAWRPEVSAETRVGVEQALQELQGNEASEDRATEYLAQQDPAICSRLVSEFHALQTDPGFHTVHGRDRVRRLHRVLYRIESRDLVSDEDAKSKARASTSDEASALRVALGWSSWWHRDGGVPRSVPPPDPNASVDPEPRLPPDGG